MHLPCLEEDSEADAEDSAPLAAAAATFDVQVPPAAVLAGDRVEVPCDRARCQRLSGRASDRDCGKVSKNSGPSTNSGSTGVVPPDLKDSSHAYRGNWRRRRWPAPIDRGASSHES
jgi:hypothetical protein